jgi:hypothetical protein
MRRICQRHSGLGNLDKSTDLTIFVTLMYSYQQVSGRLAVSDSGEFTDSAVG